MSDILYVMDYSTSNGRIVKIKTRPSDLTENGDLDIEKILNRAGIKFDSCVWMFSSVDLQIEEIDEWKDANEHDRKLIYEFNICVSKSRMLEILSEIEDKDIKSDLLEILEYQDDMGLLND